MITEYEYKESLKIVKQYEKDRNDLILESLCRGMTVTLKDVRSKSRKRHIVYARMIIANILLEKYKDDNGQPTITLMQIGNMLMKDHSSIIHYKKTFEFAKEWPEVERMYKAAKNEIHI